MLILKNVYFLGGAAEGTSCGTGKICIKGSCVANTVTPTCKLLEISKEI